MRIFVDTVYWGIFVSVGSYMCCVCLQKKRKKVFFKSAVVFDNINHSFFGLF